MEKDMDMLIRKATTADLDLVTHIEATCFPPAEAAPREAFKERLAHYADHFLIIFDGDTPIGFIDGFVTDDEILTDEMFADASMHNPDGAWQMIFGLNVNVNIRMYNFDDVQCTVIPSVAYGFVTGMNLQLC